MQGPPLLTPLPHLLPSEHFGSVETEPVDLFELFAVLSKQQLRQATAHLSVFVAGPKPLGVGFLVLAFSGVEGHCQWVVANVQDGQGGQTREQEACPSHSGDPVADELQAFDLVHALEIAEFLNVIVVEIQEAKVGKLSAEALSELFDAAISELKSTKAVLGKLRQLQFAVRKRIAGQHESVAIVGCGENTIDKVARRVLVANRQFFKVWCLAETMNTRELVVIEHRVAQVRILFEIEELDLILISFERLQAARAATTDRHNLGELILREMKVLERDKLAQVGDGFELVGRQVEVLKLIKVCSAKIDSRELVQL